MKDGREITAKFLVTREELIVLEPALENSVGSPRLQKLEVVAPSLGPIHVIHPRLIQELIEFDEIDLGSIDDELLAGERWLQEQLLLRFVQEKGNGEMLFALRELDDFRMNAELVLANS